MNFSCKELIIDNSDSGLTVSFSDIIDSGDEDKSFDEIINPLEQYLMFQRTYSEDEFETDYYYIELSDSDKSGDLDNFSVDLYKNKFHMKYGDLTIEIDLSIDDSKFNQLKIALTEVLNDKGILTLRD
ncbi:hypothetical protein [uncultured Cytophaga sp.]|uniref:hypothetical protein n=1 Tax=uncultured Cytophaga sp. TaxID=160238 RepID=UPI0026127758|nr:hypothetical protein [uncultured Cytophaga sp.]